MNIKLYSIIIILGLFVFLYSCGQTKTKNHSINSNIKNPNTSHLNSIKSESHKRVIYINKIYIPIFPSHKYLDSIQKVVPEDEWNETASDNEYYRDLAEQYLNKNEYKQLNPSKSRFWHFKLKSGNIQIIDALSLYDHWGNIIFNGKDSAFFYNGTIPEIELKGKL